MATMDERREQLAAAFANEFREHDREDDREMLFLRQNDGANRVDDRLIGLTMNASCGLFALVHGKLAHLGTGDPFKERINLFAYKHAYSLQCLVEDLVENIEEPEDNNNNNNKGAKKTMKQRLKGALTFRTMGRNTRREAPVEVPQHRDRAAMVRLRFPVFENYTTEMLNMTATGRDTAAMERVNRLNRMFQTTILNGFQNVPNEDARRLQQIRTIYQSLQRLVEITGDAARAYYVNRLGCALNVEQVVNREFERHREQRLAFDFGEFSNLSRDITRVVRVFYHVTEGVNVVRLFNDDRDRRYREVLQHVMEWNERLDPFGEDNLVIREQDPPRAEELINVGVAIVAEGQANN